jgi:protease-4
MRRWGLALAFACLVACEGRPRTQASAPQAKRQPRTGPAAAVIDLTSGAPEVEPSGLLGVGPRRRSFDQLVRTIEDLGKDKDIKSALVRFGGASMGMSRALEIGELLENLRKTKPVYCHADGFTNQTLLAASRGCSRIYVSPAGSVEAVGIAAQMVYFRKLLVDELKLSVDFLQVGKFKGAEEPFTRDGPSDEARASLESVLADLRASWLDGIKKGRSRPDVADAAEDGPYSPAKAKERGLVDEVGYADEALSALKTASGAVRDETRFGAGAEAEEPEDLGDLLRILSGEGRTAPVALIRAVGSISMSGGGGLFGGRGGITERDLGKLLARVEKDDLVKAVVLRIDSPGGSALASDLLWHQIMKVREKKPVVVSIGEMAASGGYYLSCAGSMVFAEPTSIVGSIGVVGGKIGAGSALERWGVHVETFAANKANPGAARRAAYESPMVAWDEPTRQRVLESMTSIYDLFLHRIQVGRSTMGRSMTVAQIAPSAEGRIFSGREAKARGLVDEMGGLVAAVAKAKELAKLPADARVQVFAPQAGFLEALDPGAENADEQAPLRDKARDAVAQVSSGSRLVDMLEGAAPDVVPFATSVAPLLEGERVLAAVPFAIWVK